MATNPINYKQILNILNIKKIEIKHKVNIDKDNFLYF
jgi:hypothetical protein